MLISSTHLALTGINVSRAGFIMLDPRWLALPPSPAPSSWPTWGTFKKPWSSGVSLRSGLDQPSSSCLCSQRCSYFMEWTVYKSVFQTRIECSWKNWVLTHFLFVLWNLSKIRKSVFTGWSPFIPFLPWWRSLLFLELELVLVLPEAHWPLGHPVDIKM